ncbi:bifunctional DNA primase/polymerase [Roseovarius sp.]|uniref:bifunctional DNA primase/polymerase n=1 Tax=Roseovarius sp. TaxID=1486281 RepID=UPI003BAC66A1
MVMKAEAQPSSDCRARVEAEIASLCSAGFSLLPLGGGPEGKAPLVSYAKKVTISMPQVFGAMRRADSLMYGIRLPGLVVLDLDCDDDDIIRRLEDRFGPARVQVRTPRGLHLYFRRPAASLPNLRTEGLPVDVKSGPNAYVVGPGSIRPNGEAYYYATGAQLGETEITVLATENSESAPILQPKVPEGARNRHLFQSAISMVEYVDSLDELSDNLRFERDERCVHPETVKDAEVEAIAKWAWKKRLRNSVFEGRNSAFRVNRCAVDAIRHAGGSSDALALYVTLVDQHGHAPAKAFALDHTGMREVGLTDLSRERFLKARRDLERAGLLSQVRRPVPGKLHAQFQLVTPIDGNVTRLPR